MSHGFARRPTGSVAVTGHFQGTELTQIYEHFGDFDQRPVNVEDCRPTVALDAGGPENFVWQAFTGDHGFRGDHLSFCNEID